MTRCSQAHTLGATAVPAPGFGTCKRLHRPNTAPTLLLDKITCITHGKETDRMSGQFLPDYLGHGFSISASRDMGS